MFDRWWLAAFPGIAIFVTTLAINLLGDGLRDLYDPYGGRTLYSFQPLWQSAEIRVHPRRAYVVGAPDPLT